MAEYPSRDNLTRAQREVREKAALLIAKAWKEADAMLADAGIAGDPDLFTPCLAVEDGVQCGCRHYSGDHGSTCLTLITTDPDTTPVPHRSCGHRKSQHAFGGANK